MSNSKELSLYEQAESLLKFVKDTLISGVVTAPIEEIQKRYDICKACPKWTLKVDESTFKNIRNFLKIPQGHKIAEKLFTKEYLEIFRQSELGKSKQDKIYGCSLCSCNMQIKLVCKEAHCADKENPRW